MGGREKNSFSIFYGKFVHLDLFYLLIMRASMGFAARIGKKMRLKIKPTGDATSEVLNW